MNYGANRQNQKKQSAHICLLCTVYNDNTKTDKEDDSFGLISGNHPSQLRKLEKKAKFTSPFDQNHIYIIAVLCQPFMLWPSICQSISEQIFQAKYIDYIISPSYANI